MIDIEIINGERIMFVPKNSKVHEFLHWFSGQDLINIFLTGNNEPATKTITEITEHFPLTKNELTFLIRMHWIGSNVRYRYDDDGIMISNRIEYHYFLTDTAREVLKELDILEDDDEYSTLVVRDTNYIPSQGYRLSRERYEKYLNLLKGT